MNNIAILFAGNLTQYAFIPVAGSNSAFERAVQTASGLPGVSKTVVLGGEAVPGSTGYEVIAKSKWTLSGLLSTIDECSEGFDDVFYYYADCPLIDTALTAKMYQDHQDYFAEYTFADGYPAGLAPEILQRKILKALIRLANDDTSAVSRDTLFNVIQRDINSFDIETWISPVDLRLLRVSLACDTKRNHLLVERVVRAGGRDEQTILSVLQDRADLLRTLPAYIGIQVTNRYPQHVSYLPAGYYTVGKSDRGKEMRAEVLAPIIEHLGAFAGDITVGLSYRGDPSMHSEAVKLVDAVLRVPDTQVLLETSGIGWHDIVIEDILSLSDDRITWIVELDARDAHLYKKLRGDGYEEAYRTAEFLVSRSPESVYLQAVRMKSNEEDLEQFYRYWKEKSDHVIIKKYDYFSGILPQIKVTDLSPLKRFPCWHIKRDLTILVDGTVPMCGEDIDSSKVLGNVFRDTVESIWSRGSETYLSHVAKEYPPICVECDEYYTFNF